MIFKIFMTESNVQDCQMACVSLGTSSLQSIKTFCISQATGSRVGTIVQAITTLGTATIMVLVFDWRLGLVSLPFVPFVLAAVYLQAKILMGQSVTESKTLQEAGKVV